VVCPGTRLKETSPDFFLANLATWPQFQMHIVHYTRNHAFIEGAQFKYPCQSLHIAQRHRLAKHGRWEHICHLFFTLACKHASYNLQRGVPLQVVGVLHVGVFPLLPTCLAAVLATVKVSASMP
jgi:hypothetical protein